MSILCYNFFYVLCSSPSSCVYLQEMTIEVIRTAVRVVCDEKYILFTYVEVITYTHIDI